MASASLGVGVGNGVGNSVAAGAATVPVGDSSCCGWANGLAVGVAAACAVGRGVAVCAATAIAVGDSSGCGRAGGVTERTASARAVASGDGPSSVPQAPAKPTRASNKKTESCRWARKITGSGPASRACA